MSPTLEEALEKLKANDVEAGQQILLKVLNTDPRNDAAWKYLIESYTDLDLQIELANEYFNLTGGSPKATLALLRLTRIKNDRYARLEEDESKWVKKLKWVEKIKWFGKIKWNKTFLVKVIIGLIAFILLSNMILLSSSISGSIRSSKLRSDFDRLSGVYSDLLLENSSLKTQYSQLETQYSELLATHQQLLLDYKALVERTTP
ncbi:MAG: hypothetical protein WCF08_10765 [Anaerolineaceae bacterium]